jgi:hypothetical protein
MAVPRPLATYKLGGFNSATRKRQIMKRIVSPLAVIVVCQALPFSFGSAVAAEAPRTIALTFDDLPNAGNVGGDTLENAERVTKDSTFRFGVRNGRHIRHRLRAHVALEMEQKQRRES